MGWLTCVVWACSVNPVGGTAYLSLENTEEPFLAGIKFTAMPPSKRFREIEQLSGGEKVRRFLFMCFVQCHMHGAPCAQFIPRSLIRAAWFFLQPLLFKAGHHLGQLAMQLGQHLPPMIIHRSQQY